MVENAQHPIRIDLNEFKLHIDLRNKISLTLHFNSPSRRFYLSLIAFVVNEMKKRGKIISIPLEEHLDLLALLNESVGGSAGSSDKKNLLPRIYRKWQHALPNLEEAPLFKVLGRKKKYDEENGKTYQFTEAEKDNWANLFEYKGSEENVRLKFAIDKIGVSLNDIVITYEGFLNTDAWENFISSLKEKEEKKPKAELTNHVSEEPEVPSPQLGKRKISRPNRFRWGALIASIIVVLGAITLAIWKTYLKPARINVASIEKMAFPLPDKPSIAVLPFVNLSGDPKQEFFCDGITESIITALSKVPRLFVIARNSTYTYKGKTVKIKQVSEELGVRYVLEGSVQRSADRVRITAQLIDALTGHHIWAERYDRDLKDIFVLQDEITMKILTATQVKLTTGEVSLGDGKHYRGKQGLDCYLKILEGSGYVERQNIEDNNLARRIAEEVIAMCPEVPMAYQLMAWVHVIDYWLGSTNSPWESTEKGIEAIQKAIALDDTLAEAHALLSHLYTQKREYDKSIVEGERAVALNPSSATAIAFCAVSLQFACRPEEAIPLFQKAIRLNPHGPIFYYRNLGFVFWMTGRYEEAVSTFKKVIQRSPNHITVHLGLAATYIMIGREQEARDEAVEVLRIDPNFSLDRFAKVFPYKDQSVTDNLINACRKAGLK
jgi:adenylate cyclase